MASTVPSYPVDIDAHLFEQAQASKIDVRYVCERALKRAMVDRQMTADEFYAANRDAIDQYNAWIAEHGLPFEDMRAYK